MVLTKEERCELLKRAREAKKAKSDAKKQEKKDNPPPKGRPKKKVEEKTLDLDLDEKKEEEVIPLADYSEPEVEEIVEVRKVPKKKKIIRKKIIQQYESGTDEEIIEEVQAPIRRTRPQQAQVKEVEKPIPLEEPKEPEKPRFDFNLFDY